MMEEAFHIYSNRVFINAYAWNINYALFSRVIAASVLLCFCYRTLAGNHQLLILRSPVYLPEMDNKINET